MATNNAINTALPTNGQLLIGSTGNAPVAASLTSTNASITYTAGVGTLNLDIAAMPSFFAYVDATVPNVTGDGTVYTVIFNTEEFDTLSNFNTTTGMFTAPTDGLYCLGAQMTLDDIGAQHTQLNFHLTLSTGQIYPFDIENPRVIGSPILLTRSSSALMQMASGTSAFITIQVSGVTKLVDVVGNADKSQTIFWGYRVLRT